MAKDDNPFGSEPPEHPFGRPPKTDAFGRPIAAGDGASGSPEPADPFGSPAPAAAPPPRPSPDDMWRGPAPPPADGYAPPVIDRAEGAIAALVLGIISVIICPLMGPVAWSLGRKAEQLVDASDGALSGRGEATTGRILGIIGTVFLVGGILFIAAAIILGLSLVESGGTTTFEY